jgi:hypothetical protein
MIAAFLKAEISSERHKSLILNELTKNKWSEELILKAKINVGENKKRYSILTNGRGYGTRTLLFDSFPNDVKWYSTTFSQDELLKVKYTRYVYWFELSNKTRDPSVAVENINNGVELYNQSNDLIVKAAEAFANKTKFAEMILVGASVDDLVVLEGHLRLTAYVMAGSKAPKSLKVFIGLSQNMPNWVFY